jgi:hypothetical protein
MQPEETLKGMPVVDLELHMFIREVIESIENQDLEHQHHVIGFPPRRRLPGFGQHRFQLWAKKIQKSICCFNVSSGTFSLVSFARRSASSKKLGW